MDRFGAKIEELRNNKSVTGAEAAKALGIPQSRLRELEKGVRVPTEGQVNRMETYYSVGDGELASLLGQ